MSRWLITNARLVNEGDIIETDVRIGRGRIDRIDGELSAGPRETVVDARGAYLLPGMIDTRVHFREPGLTRKGNMASESRAAVAGGVTSFLDLPDTRPTTTSLNALADKFSRAHGRATANYSFFLGFDGTNHDEVRSAGAASACGLSIRVDGSGRAGPLSDPEHLARLISDSELLACLHGEDEALVETNRRRLLEAHGGELTPQMHPLIHIAEAERIAVEHARTVTGLTDRSVHVTALGSAANLDPLDRGPLEHKQLSAAVDLPQLYFMEADYRALGNLIKNEPPIRSAEDRLALRRALADDRIDLIDSGHAPQLLRDKGLDYVSAVPGMPLVQFALPAAWALVASRMLTPARLVDKIAHNPARRFRIADRGFVREGYWADLTLLDANRRCEVDRQPGLSQCGWTPFSGRKLPATVRATWVNGELVWRAGLLTGRVPGQRLSIGGSAG
jgi:dihydroorotase